MLKAAPRPSLQDLVQDRLSQNAEIRPFPAAVTRLLAAIQDESATATTFEKIIECDPGLSVRILKMANSPFCGLANEVRSVGHATSVLGNRKLKSLALSVAGGAIFSDSASAAKERQARWSHSMGCATVARLLAKSLPDLSPDDAFLAGIFHDVGKLLLYDVVPEDYARLHTDCFGQAHVDEEKRVFGVTHEEIGLTSAHSWGLSKEVKTAIGFHHHATTSPIHAEYATLIHVANGLALFLGHRLSGWRCGIRTSRKTPSSGWG